MEIFQSGVLTEGALVGIGNPLLDISAAVDEELLRKYGLKPNDAIMAEKKHWPLYKELTDKYKAEYFAGGSVQNTLRVVQWLVKKPKVCSYFGCVGDDDYAKILKEKAEADGVNVLYQVNPDIPTGTCAVLLTDGGTHRSLCANLAAAQKFTPDHLAKPESKQVIETAKIFYSSGFFIAVSQESLMQIAKHAHETNLIFALNVSAPFVMEFFKPQLEELLPYVDVLFGNDSEMCSFVEAFGLKGDRLIDIAPTIAALPKLNTARSRVVVITRSEQPVILVEKGNVHLIPVKPLSKEEIVDTNGAGDAFTGGFISQMIQGKPYKECVQCGIYAAAHVIGHSGCTFTGESSFLPEI